MTLENQNLPAQPDLGTTGLEGLDPSFFEPEQAQTAPTVPNTNAPVVPEQAPEATQAPEDLTKFNTQLQQYLGIGLQDIVTMRDAFVEQQRQSQLSQLREAWGTEYDTLLPQVQERIRQLPPAKQALLNNVEGALLVAQVLRQQQSLSGGVVPQSQPPRFDSTASSALPVQQSQYKFKLSEISKMTDRERARRHGEILEAYANGWVERDL